MLVVAQVHTPMLKLHLSLFPFPTWFSFSRSFRMNIHHVSGSVFTTFPWSSLAHCVSQNARFGAGIAVAFEARYHHARMVRDQRAPVGGVVPIFDPVELRFIYHLVTKKWHWHKPTLAAMKSSLLAMKRHAELHHVPFISIPRIGCGLDGLDWRNEVLPIIHEVFNMSSVTIYVFHLPE